MQLIFKGSKQITSDVVSFYFEPSEPVSWQPGQYMHYLLPHGGEDDRGHERWFTISNAPSEQEIAISTRINSQKSSSFKSALQSLKPGDAVEADGPKGKFVVEDPSRNYIFVAGGIGITPFRSILVQAAKDGQQLNVLLLYANRTNEVPFADELNILAEKNPKLKIEYIIDPQKISAELIKKRADELDNPMVYISGPEPMVKDLADQLAETGFPPDSTKTDDFPGYENY